MNRLLPLLLLVTSKALAKPLMVRYEPLHDLGSPLIPYTRCIILGVPFDNPREALRRLKDDSDDRPRPNEIGHHILKSLLMQCIERDREDDRCTNEPEYPDSLVRNSSDRFCPLRDPQPVMNILESEGEKAGDRDDGGRGENGVDGVDGVDGVNGVNGDDGMDGGGHDAGHHRRSGVSSNGAGDKGDIRGNRGSGGNGRNLRRGDRGGRGGGNGDGGDGGSINKRRRSPSKRKLGGGDGGRGRNGGKLAPKTRRFGDGQVGEADAHRRGRRGIKDGESDGHEGREGTSGSTGRDASAGLDDKHLDGSRSKEQKTLAMTHGVNVVKT